MISGYDTDGLYERKIKGLQYTGETKDNQYDYTKIEKRKYVMLTDFKKGLFYSTLIALLTFAICIVLELHYIREEIQLLLEKHNSITDECIIDERITRIEELLE